MLVLLVVVGVVMIGGGVVGCVVLLCLVVVVLLYPSDQTSQTPSHPTGHTDVGPTFADCVGMGGCTVSYGLGIWRRYQIDGAKDGCRFTEMALINYSWAVGDVEMLEAIMISDYADTPGIQNKPCSGGERSHWVGARPPFLEYVVLGNTVGVCVGAPLILDAY